MTEELFRAGAWALFMVICSPQLPEYSIKGVKKLFVSLTPICVCSEEEFSSLRRRISPVLAHSLVSLKNDSIDQKLFEIR